MKLFTALIAAAAMLAGAAQARDLEQIEGAYEAMLGNVTLPGSTAGSAIFRTCGSCETVGLRVNAQTVFQVSGRALPLADFLAAVDEIHDGQGGISALVAIYYDLDTTTITRINVVPPRG